MKILYVYRTARKKIYEEAKNNAEPDHQLYGANHLEKLGYQIEFSDIAYSPLNLLHSIFYPLERLLINLTSIGFKLDQAILLLPKAYSSSFIVTTTDSAGLPFLFLKSLRLIRRPIIYISTGLINELNKRSKKLIFKIYKYFLKKTSMIICHSSVEKELFIRLIPELKGRVVFVHFGINSSYFKSTSSKRDTILSIGRDRSRDYKLLAEVARSLSKEKFTVVTSPSNVIDIPFSQNVKLYFDLPYHQVKKLYSTSKIVFLPLRELSRASGQIAFLEGIASKNKVVVADVEGITKSYPDLIGSEGVYTYKCGDSKEAEAKIYRALRENVRLKSLGERYSSRFYAKHLKKMIESLKHES